MITKTRKKLLPFVLLGSLTACGGGGGSSVAGLLGIPDIPSSETLHVDVKYGNYVTGLFSTVKYVPQTSGFQEHTPQCSMASGSMPDGIVLNRDCSITGEASTIGTYPFTVRITANGVSNSITASGSIQVSGPTLHYPMASIPLAVVGAGAESRPSIGHWENSLAAQSVWHFALVGGTLPPGFTLDPSTGVITGTYTEKGTFTAAVQGTVTTPVGTFKTGSAINAYFNVGEQPVIPVVGNLNFYRYPDGQSTYTAYLGQMLSVAPSPRDSTTYVSFKTDSLLPLPEGLSMAPLTGAISGIPVATAWSDTALIVTYRQSNMLFSARGSVRITVKDPISLTYGVERLTYAVGQPIDIQPQVTPISPEPVNDATYSYTLANTCTLPPGVTIEAATGRISGTPSAKISDYSESCNVLATVTSGGVSRIQTLSIIFTPSLH